MTVQSQGRQFASVVHSVAEEIRKQSGADIVAIYPFDEAADSFYAPVSVGLPEGDVVSALPDLRDQWRRFRADQAEGKAGDELQPTQYGPSAWLLAIRKPLISSDAGHEVAGSFIRRHHIQSLLGLPLQIGSSTVGLLYLNFLKRDGDAAPVQSAEYVERMQSLAVEAAERIDGAKRVEDRRTLQALTSLVDALSAAKMVIPDEQRDSSVIQSCLQQVREQVRVGAVVLVLREADEPSSGEIVTAGLPEGARLPVPEHDENPEDCEELKTALAHAGLHAVRCVNVSAGALRGDLLFADPDPYILDRQPPSAESLLQAAADLLVSVCDYGHLLDELGESNRTLGAVTRLGTRLLQPGSTQGQVLHMAADALTDPELPELDFDFAAFYLLDSTADGSLLVTSSAGVTTSSEVPAREESDPTTMHGAGVRRVPDWLGAEGRKLGADDIVSYVATRRRAVVVAAADAPDDIFLSGYPESGLERLRVPVGQPTAEVARSVRAIRLRESADRAPLQAGSGRDAAAYRQTTEFTLDAHFFDHFRHGQVVRVFMPFGPIHTDSAGKRASGVLEAGYHISRRARLERVQIEALRACAAMLASAIESARLYEDARQRAGHLEIINEVSRAIATSIDLDQTLKLVARNMARAVDASVCLIALLEEDGSAWYGAAASDMEEVWCGRRVERPERNIVFEVADRQRPIVVENAQDHPLVSGYTARLLGIRSLVALPLVAGEAAMGAVILGERSRVRTFSEEEVERAAGLTNQAAIAITNARVHAREEEEQHIQKDVVLVGFGQWGQKAYKHLVLLKNFFNFRTHVVEWDRPGRRAELADAESAVAANGDVFYWDSAETPARDVLTQELEPSCYVITYIATPAETHLPLLKAYYELSNVVLIEKPLGAPPEEYRTFLDRTDGTVQIVAADHYWFKMEVRLLELLLTEERNLRAFLEEIEEIEVEILEEQAPGGSGAQIGMIADLVPHAFAILSLLTPLDRLQLDDHEPLQVGRFEPFRSDHETYARLRGFFEHRGRKVRVTIDVGKGVTNAKWIKLSGGARMGGRRSFYKFDFARGEAIDGTQSALRAAVRPVRQPGVPDNAHLSMLRHVIEKKHPAVGILSIREALRANARIQALEHTAAELIAQNSWTPYQQGQRPAFTDDGIVRLQPASAVEG